MNFVHELIGLDEARNPHYEYNSLMKKIITLVDEHNGDDLYITFTDLKPEQMGNITNQRKLLANPKIGLNPKSTFQTPNGVYTFPVSLMINHARDIIKNIRDHGSTKVENFPNEREFLDNGKVNNNFHNTKVKHEILSDTAIDSGIEYPIRQWMNNYHPEIQYGPDDEDLPKNLDDAKLKELSDEFLEYTFQTKASPRSGGNEPNFGQTQNNLFPFESITNSRHIGVLKPVDGNRPLKKFKTNHEFLNGDSSKSQNYIIDPSDPEHDMVRRIFMKHYYGHNLYQVVKAFHDDVQYLLQNQQVTKFCVDFIDNHYHGDSMLNMFVELLNEYRVIKSVILHTNENKDFFKVEIGNNIGAIESELSTIDPDLKHKIETNRDLILRVAACATRLVRVLRTLGDMTSANKKEVYDAVSALMGSDSEMDIITRFTPNAHGSNAISMELINLLNAYTHFAVLLYGHGNVIDDKQLGSDLLWNRFSKITAGVLNISDEDIDPEILKVVEETHGNEKQFELVGKAIQQHSPKLFTLTKYNNPKLSDFVISFDSTTNSRLDNDNPHGILHIQGNQYLDMFREFFNGFGSKAQVWTERISKLIESLNMNYENVVTILNKDKDNEHSIQFKIGGSSRSILDKPGTPLKSNRIRDIGDSNEYSWSNLEYDLHILHDYFMNSETFFKLGKKSPFKSLDKSTLFRIIIEKIIKNESTHARYRTPGGILWGLTRALCDRDFIDSLQDHEEKLSNNKEILEKYNNNIKYKDSINNIIVGYISLSSVSDNKRTLINLWNLTFQKVLGYGSIGDTGHGIIHPNEPAQAVFFNPKLYKVIEILDNKVYSNLDIVKKYSNESIKHPKDVQDKISQVFNGYLDQLQKALTGEINFNELFVRSSDDSVKKLSPSNISEAIFKEEVRLNREPSKKLMQEIVNYVVLQATIIAKSANPNNVKKFIFDTIMQGIKDEYIKFIEKLSEICHTIAKKYSIEYSKAVTENRISGEVDAFYVKNFATKWSDFGSFNDFWNDLHEGGKKINPSFGANHGKKDDAFYNRNPFEHYASLISHGDIISAFEGGDISAILFIMLGSKMVSTILDDEESVKFSSKDLNQNYRTTINEAFNTVFTDNTLMIPHEGSSIGKGIKIGSDVRKAMTDNVPALKQSTTYKKRIFGDIAPLNMLQVGRVVNQFADALKLSSSNSEFLNDTKFDGLFKLVEAIKKAPMKFAKFDFDRNKYHQLVNKLSVKSDKLTPLQNEFVLELTSYMGIPGVTLTPSELNEYIRKTWEFAKHSNMSPANGGPIHEPKNGSNSDVMFNDWLNPELLNADFDLDNYSSFKKYDPESAKYLRQALAVTIIHGASSNNTISVPSSSTEENGMVAISPINAHRHDKPFLKRELAHYDRSAAAPTSTRRTATMINSTPLGKYGSVATDIIHNLGTAQTPFIKDAIADISSDDIKDMEVYENFFDKLGIKSRTINSGGAIVDIDFLKGKDGADIIPGYSLVNSWSNITHNGFVQIGITGLSPDDISELYLSEKKPFDEKKYAYVATKYLFEDNIIDYIKMIDDMEVVKRHRELSDSDDKETAMFALDLSAWAYHLAKDSHLNNHIASRDFNSTTVFTSVVTCFDKGERFVKTKTSESQQNLSTPSAQIGEKLVKYFESVGVNFKDDHKLAKVLRICSNYLLTDKSEQSESLKSFGLNLFDADKLEQELFNGAMAFANELIKNEYEWIEVKLEDNVLVARDKNT